MRGEMQNTLENVERHAVLRNSFADTRSKDETKSASASFLVGMHEVNQLLGMDVGPRRKRPHAADERNDAGDLVGGGEADFVAEERGGHHAPSDGFAVLVDAIIGEGFESVAESVAEIEDFAEAGLALVAADDASFDLKRAGNQIGECRRITTQNSIEIFLQIGKELRVRDDAVLDNFGEAAAVLAFWQGFEGGRINEDEAGRIKSADEVLPFGQIHAGFSTDVAVHLCDQGSGDLHKLHSAETSGSGESRDVADHPAAHSNEERLAIDSAANERAAKLFNCGEIFRGFRIIHQMRRWCTSQSQSGDNRLPHCPPYSRRGNQMNA